MLALPLKFQPVGAIQTSKPRRRDSVDRRISSKPPPFERSSTLASGKCKLRAFWARTRMCRKFGRVEMEPSYQALHVVYSLKQKTIPATSSSSSTSSVEEFSIFLSCHRLHGQGCTRRRPPTFTRTILKVGIVEKGIGKSKSIQITNSKGCLSEPEITHMVKVTEDFAAEDETIVLDVYGVRTTVSVACSKLRSLPSFSPFFSAVFLARNHPQNPRHRRRWRTSRTLWWRPSRKMVQKSERGIGKKETCTVWRVAHC